jgi:hypothetical protein
VPGGHEDRLQDGVEEAGVRAGGAEGLCGSDCAAVPGWWGGGSGSGGGAAVPGAIPNLRPQAQVSSLREDAGRRAAALGYSNALLERIENSLFLN